AELAQAKHVLSQKETVDAFLLKFSDALRPLGDALEIQRVACRIVRDHFGASRVMYAETVGHEELVEMAFDAEDNAHPHPIRYRIADFGAEVVLELRAGKPTWREDVLADARLSESENSAASAIGVRASANAPLVKNGNLVAMLGVHWKDPHAWSASELELLREVADRTWAATERARAEAALHKSTERLQLALEGAELGAFNADLATSRLECD